MEKEGISSNIIIYNTLMDAYSKSDQIEEAEGLFLEMNEKGLKQKNAATYNTLVDAYSRRMQPEIVESLVTEMQDLGLKPNVKLYTYLITLLDAFRQAGETDKLMEIWKFMISNKVEGTRVTFNIILDGLAKHGLYVQARDVIYEFGKLGLPPTVMTYNILMNAYAQGGQHCKLPQLLKDPSVLNLKPDSVTYSTMIYAYVCVCDFTRAFYYHKQMVRSGQRSIMTRVVGDKK
ncbi:hypothetical protein OPV22_013665 [Ensete ventricosum]|uniref:Pentacotripeptide-repeat region of PRORP domain-containing protein n=1 Tax=Ensete ventricosum TaxID=4639 RepID=A0AAV8PNL7_ENSVE|nr:hypothetical protein OPV22_013665 [Ensete ventricosum]